MKKTNSKQAKKVLRKQFPMTKSSIKNSEKEPISILLGDVSTKTKKKSLKFKKILMETRFRQI